MNLNLPSNSASQSAPPPVAPAKMCETALVRLLPQLNCDCGTDPSTSANLGRPNLPLNVQFSSGFTAQFHPRWYQLSHLEELPL